MKNRKSTRLALFLFLLVGTVSVGSYTFASDIEQEIVEKKLSNP